MMEAIIKQRELMKKKPNGKIENINNNLKKVKVINNNETKQLKTSLKDKIGVFENSNKGIQKNIDDFKSKGKGPPQKENNNNTNNDNNKIKINNLNNISINNNLTNKSKKEKKLSKSFNKIARIPEILTLQKSPKKYFKTIHILYNVKLDMNNFIIKDKKNNIENEDIDEIIKINEIQPINRNKTTYSKKDKDKDSMKKKNSLLDENNKLTIKLKSKNTFTKEDFEIVNFLGKGAYGTVLQVTLVKDPKKKIYAIKKLDINSLISVNRLYQAYLENDILNELNSPYIVKVYGAFEADEKIHIVMDYMPKGDFAYFIKSNYPLRTDMIKFYAAEMVAFLEYMQKMKLIHRDLKPQNIMIDDKGHLKVIDFGTVRKKGYYFDKREMKFTKV